MKLIETLCQQLGLSQQQLAAFAHTDRSLISKTQRGQRQMTADALLHITHLYAVYNSLPDASADADADAYPEAQCQAWEHRLQQCRHRLVQLNRQQAAARDSYEKAALLLQFTGALAQQEGAAFTARQQRWIEQRQYEARKKMDGNNAGQRKQLQIQISLLETEIALLEEALAGEQV